MQKIYVVAIITMTDDFDDKTEKQSENTAAVTAVAAAITAVAAVAVADDDNNDVFVALDAVLQSCAGNVQLKYMKLSRIWNIKLMQSLAPSFALIAETTAVVPLFLMLVKVAVTVAFVVTDIANVYLILLQLLT